jgi:hypothetical protein
MPNTQLTSNQIQELAELVEALSREWDMLSKQIYYVKRVNETSRFDDMYREISNARSECNHYLEISEELLAVLDKVRASN